MVRPAYDPLVLADLLNLEVAAREDVGEARRFQPDHPQSASSSIQIGLADACDSL